MGAGKTVTIHWHSPTVLVLASPDDGSLDSGAAFLSLAAAWPFDDAPEEIALPQDC